MDEMDRMLQKLPEHRPPSGMARRVALSVRRRQRRRQVVQYSLSAALVLVGCVLFGPWALGSLAQIELPQSGFPLLASTFNVVYNTGPAVTATWDGINSIQSSLSQSIGLFEAAGLVCLAAGTLLGIEPLLPHTAGDARQRSW